MINFWKGIILPLELGGGGILRSNTPSIQPQTPTSSVYELLGFSMKGKIGMVEFQKSPR